MNLKLSLFNIGISLFISSVIISGITYGSELGLTENSRIRVRAPIALESFDHIKLVIYPGEVTIALFDIDRTLTGWEGLINFSNDIQTEVANSYINIMELYKTKDGVKYFSEFWKWYTWALKVKENDYKFEEHIVEDSVKTLLKFLKENGVIVFGLTARKFEIADATKNRLAELGIDFSKSAKFIHPSNNGKNGFKDGIFYTGNMVRKAEIITNIVELIQQNRETKIDSFKIYHFDDSQLELNALAAKDGCEHNLNTKISVVLYHYLKDIIEVNNLLKNLKTLYDEISLYHDFFHLFMAKIILGKITESDEIDVKLLLFYYRYNKLELNQIDFNRYIAFENFNKLPQQNARSSNCQ